MQSECLEKPKSLIEEIEQPDGTFKVFVTLGDTKRPARNVDHAKQLLDAYKPIVKETEGPFGGYMKHPPINCKYRVVDKEAVWVESIICSGVCKDVFCKTYLTLTEGSKTRRKLLDTEKSEKDCPWCHSPISEVSQDLITTTYSCGTSGNRLTKEYIKLCGKEKPNRRRR